MQRRTKILIVSASPILATGMAEVIRLIFETLLDRYAAQYELHQVALFHSNAIAEPRWPVYPTRSICDDQGERLFSTDDVDGQITFREVAARVRPDIVFVFNDPQKVLHLCDAPQKRRHKLILYLNFDGFPYPPGHGPILNRADRIFTMSKFAKRVVLSCLPAIDRSKVDYMYSPADINRFRPLSDSEKVLRAKSLPDWMPENAFILGWVGRNQWRKQVWLPYQIVGHLRRGGYLLCNDCGRVTMPAASPARLAPKTPAQKRMLIVGQLGSNPCAHCRSISIKAGRSLRDVFLWVHMPDEPRLQDWDRSILEDLSATKPRADVRYTPGGFKNPNEIPSVYGLFDCLLFLSGGEGFGLPPWEAMCSGIPVVYTNYSSHAEYLSEAGAGLPVGGVLQPEVGTSIWRMIADIPQAIQSVRKLYFDRELGRRLGGCGRDYVQRYATGTQAESWHEVFQNTLSMPSDKQPSVISAETF